MSTKPTPLIETNEAGIRQAAQRESATGICIATLRVIAHGAWNAGRSEPITVEEYARDALAVVLQTWSPPMP